MRFHPIVSRVAQVMGRQLQYILELREYAEQRQRAHREAHATLNTIAFVDFFISIPHTETVWKLSTSCMR